MPILARTGIKLIISGFIVSLTLIFTISSAVAAADEQSDPTDETIATIKAGCVNAQVIIQQLKYSDAANRVNRGQGYESLLTRLMTPMNSRAALNGFNSSAANLTGTTTRYQQLLSSFKKHYEAYDDALGSALRLKCQNKPVEFYRHLVEARKQRASLANDIVALAQITEEYRLGVTKLRSEVQ